MRMAERDIKEGIKGLRGYGVRKAGGRRDGTGGGESSGAPGGGVAAVGADDVAGFSLAEVGATCLNRCWVVSKKQSACLGGEAAGARIGVAILSVDAAWSDKVVPAPINITFRSHGRVATCGGTKLRFVNSAKKLGHLTLLSIHLVIDLLLFGLLGIKAALFGPMFLRHSFGVGRKLFPFEITAVVRLLNGFHFEGAAGLGGLFD